MLGRWGGGEIRRWGESMNQSESRIGLIRSHIDLEVYQSAFSHSMEIYQASKKFPREETYSLTDQIRRSSRSVCANIAEAWRKRRYEAAFVSKLSDSETEATETQVWIQYAVECGYWDHGLGTKFYKNYDQVIGMLVNMINNPKPWLLKKAQ